MAKSKFGAGLIIGAVIGGAAALLLSPKTGKENREIAKKKLEEWKKRFEGKSADQIAKEIFGSASAEGKKLYSHAQAELNTRLDKLRASTDEIDQGKYKAVVQDVMDRLSKEKEATTERLEKLRTFLLDRWDYVQEESQEDAKKVAKEVKKNGKKK